MSSVCFASVSLPLCPASSLFVFVFLSVSAPFCLPNSFCLSAYLSAFILLRPPLNTTHGVWVLSSWGSLNKLLAGSAGFIYIYSRPLFQAWLMRSISAALKGQARNTFFLYFAFPALLKVHFQNNLFSLDACVWCAKFYEPFGKRPANDVWTS